MTDQITDEYVDAEPTLEPGPPAPIRIPWAPVPKVNLLPIEIIEARRFQQTRMGLAAAVLAAVVVAGGATFLAQESVTDANDQLLVSQARITTLQSEQAKYAAVPAVITQVEDAVAARTLAMGNDVLWYRYLNDLDGARPTGVLLDSIALSIGSSGTSAGGNALVTAGLGSVAVTGTASEYSQVSSWLEAVDEISGIDSSTMSNAAKSESTVSFGSSAVITSDALSHRYDTKAG